MTMKRIGVLTSGGDASGMNAAVRAVVRTALYYGIEPIGIARGYAGLIDADFRSMDYNSVTRIMREGGTVLYSDRCDEFKTSEGQKIALKNCQKAGIDGIVVIGGDGTLRGAGDLCKLGIPCIGVPATIDNDITATDYTIGFDTALDTIIDMVDRLKDTSVSHARCSVVEVMGRGAGLLALYSGLAGCACGIVVKERPFDEERFYRKLKEARDSGRRDFTVIVSENMGEQFAEELCERITQHTGIFTRFARLAHVQRGGVPTVRDRVAASTMGTEAVQLLMNGISGKVICERHNDYVAYDIDFALKLDALYKGKLTVQQIEAIPRDEYLRMMEIIKEREEEFNHIHKINKFYTLT